MKFWFVIFLEAIFAPFLYLYNSLKNWISLKYSSEENTHGNEKGIKINHLVFVVHEWSGYPIERMKQLKPAIAPFPCGLKTQIDSLVNFDSKFRSELTADYYLTISDFNNSYKEMLINSKLPIGMFEIIGVSNVGMDFAGYGHIVREKINYNPDELVFLINSSVSGNYGDKLNDYVHYFEKNPNLGLLGISYCTKVNQSLIKNNFNPHLQSFFLVFRSDVLRALYEKNNNEFPGEFEVNKYSIIRFGEVKLTSLVMKLGYDVGVVEPDGEVFLFPRITKTNNGYNSWKLGFGDRRFSNQRPNTVHAIQN